VSYLVHSRVPVWCVPSPSHQSLAAILQRVLSASVTVEKELVSSIGKGVLVFAAVAPGDTEKEADSLAAKVIKLKLWDDENGGRVFGPPNPSFTQAELLTFVVHPVLSPCLTSCIVEEERPRHRGRGPLRVSVYPTCVHQERQ